MPISINSVRKPLAVAAVAALAFTLGACGGSDEAPAPEPAASVASSAPPVEPSPSAPASSPATASPSASPSASDDDNDALLAAGALGAKEVSGGTVVSIESERDGWEVTVVTDNGGEQQLRVDGQGDLVSGPTDERPDAEDRTENQQFAEVGVDYEEAVEAVTDEIDGGQISDLTLDREDRRTVWEADVTVGSEQRSVQVDASSGEVVSNRLDD